MVPDCYHILLPFTTNLRSAFVYVVHTKHFLRAGLTHCCKEHGMGNIEQKKNQGVNQHIRTPANLNLSPQNNIRFPRDISGITRIGDILGFAHIWYKADGEIKNIQD